MSSSFRRTDILALSGLRNDGRKHHEVRRLRIQLGPLAAEQCNGSALVEMGLTVALASVRGPIECTRRSDELPDKAVVDVLVKTAAFSTSTDRRSTNPRTDRRLLEVSHLLRRAMEATIMLKLFPRQKFEIVVVILADDGARVPASINASTLALIEAGIPIKDLCCACNAGMGDGEPMVDLNRPEELAGSASLLCATMPQRDALVLTQCEARLTNYDALERLLESAMEGCRAICEQMQAAVQDRVITVLRERNAKVHRAHFFGD